MHIGFVTPQFVTPETYKGGPGFYVYRWARGLVSQGHDVHVLVYSRAARADVDFEGMQVHYLPLPGFVYRLRKLSRLDRSLRYLGFSFLVYRKLWQLNHQQPLDIVHFINWELGGLVSLILLRKMPSVLNILSYLPALSRYMFPVPTADNRAVLMLERLQMRLAKHIMVPSHLLRRIVVSEEGLSDVSVVHPAFYIEVEEWDESLYNERLKGKDYLLFFGHFRPYKGVHILARALPRFFERYPDAYAVMAGPDFASDLGPSMHQYVRDCNQQYTDRLIIMDTLPHSQLYPVIAGARLVVLPSLFDNLPNAVFEAMSLGRPLIGTEGASFDEIITDGENGFLVPLGDVDALAEKIVAAWEHPRLGEIGAAARETMREFSPDRVTEELLTYYRSVLDKHSAKQDGEDSG